MALVLATLDPIGAMAGWDQEKFRALLADVTVADLGLLAWRSDGRVPLAGGRPVASLPVRPANQPATDALVSRG